MRTLDADLTLAQQSDVRRPYITMTFSKGRGSATTYTYATDDVPNRIKYIRHSEEPYSHQAVVVLSNFDRSLPDLFGYYCEMSYGYVTEVGTPSSTTAPLWVKQQFHTSKMGSLDNILYLRGAWDFLADTADIGSLLGATTPPYFEVDYTGSGYTIYDIIDQILAAAGFGLHALGGEDDSIIDTLTPSFLIQLVPFENATSAVYRLLNMTKVFCRAEAPSNGEIALRKTYFIGGSGIGSLSDGAEMALHGGGISASPAEEYALVIPGDGTVSDFYVELDGTPGSSKSWTITVQQDTGAGFANTDLAVTIADSATTGNDTTDSIGVSAGDRLILKVTQSGSPTARKCRWTLTYSGIAPSSSLTPVVGGGITNNAATRYGSVAGIWGALSTTTENETRRVMPCAGTVKNLYVVLSASPGTDPDAYRFTVRKGGASQALTVTVTAPNTSGNDTANSFSVSAGDVLTMMMEPLNSPSASPKAWWGWEFEPTTTTYNVILGGSKLTIGGADSKYHHVFPSGFWQAWGNNEADRWQRIGATTLKNLYVHLSAAPGAGHSYTFKIYKNSAATDLSVTISDTDTTGSDTVNSVTTVDGDEISFHWEPYPETVLYCWWGLTSEPSGIEAEAMFRIKYPSGYSSYDYTYTSDKPTATSHQFKEFEWRDQPMLPNHVKVLANQSADGTWGSVITGEYTLGISNNNNYPDTLIYHVAGSLTTQANADNRAAAIALRMWMEKQLGRVVVPHNCGQELYDWIKIRDNRGAESYTDYPPTRWGNEAVVGSLVHVYDPANAIYDLEITINGISSSMPIVPVYEFKEAIEDVKDAADELYEGLERVRDEAREEAGPLTLRYPPTIPGALTMGTWNATANMLTNTAGFRRALQSQIFRHLAGMGFGPGAGGWAEGGIFGEAPPEAEGISPEMWKAWPRDPSGAPLPISPEEAARLRQSIEGEPLEEPTDWDWYTGPEPWR